MREHIVAFLRHLTAVRNVSPHTVRSYGSDLEQLSTFLGNPAPSSVTHQDLRRYLGHLVGGGAQRSSLARKLSAVRAFFKYLSGEGAVSHDPARLVATPRQERR